MARLMRSHTRDKPLEQVVGVMGARTRFRVILNRKQRQGFVPQACDGAIVEVEVGDLDLGLKRVGADREAMVLAGDFDVLFSATGLIEPAMTELEFVSIGS